MSDDYRECTTSMLAFLWALPLFGAEQLARMLFPHDAGSVRHRATAAFVAVTRAAETQFGEASREVFQAGDQLQRGMVDCMHSLVPLEALTPRHMTKMTLELMQQSAEAFGSVMPGRDNRLAWREFRNKLQAFNLFEHVDLTLRLSPGTEVPLATLVERANALGPYLAVWAMEGLGRHYAEAYWEYQGTPRHLLADDQGRALPAASLIPLHTGMGLSLADRLLSPLKPHSPEAEIDTALRHFIALCRHCSRAGYMGAVLEALGLVTRLRYPQMVRMIDWRLLTIAPDVADYFWHGVGRGLYFLPLNAIPCGNSGWQAAEMAQAEAPHSSGRLNALGGLAWALTLVNIRHPEVLEAFLNRYSDVLVTDDAFSTGVSTSLMIWYDIARDDPYLRAFMHYQPDSSSARLAQLWDCQVRRPSHAALHRYYGMLKARHGLGEVFRYQPLSTFVDRLAEEPVG
jgi:hypothetical protein